MIPEAQLALNRRQFFSSTGLGMGSLALSSLLNNSANASSVHPKLQGFPHIRPRAKAVIYLHMNGGPSQLDTWDYKPGLKDYFGKDLPDSIRNGQRLSTMTSKQAKFPVAPSQFEFTQHGQCGRWVSSLLPHTAKLVDELALIKTVQTNAINHDPACTYVMTGSEQPGRPSIGSWLSYGLGAATSNLPAFVALMPRYDSGSNGQALYSRLWGSGFLPGKHTGVVLRASGDPVLYLDNPPGVTRSGRRGVLDTLGELNAQSFARIGDPDIQTRIAQYEMSFRMQSSVPELTDISKESKATLGLYGPQVSQPGSFAATALQARRLVERGVRVVQIMHRGWDSHGNLPKELSNQCRDTDQGCAGLLMDLKMRGMLDDTLVVWGGEFGRTVYSQGALTKERYGRDHHPRNFCMWMAGGGVKGGIVHGETDDFSYSPITESVNVNDVNATIMHCLGIDHERFTIRHQGLDIRLTGVDEARPIREILA